MSERLHGAYLLLGPEEGEKTAFIEKLTKSIAASAGAPDVYRFHAFEAKMAEVVLSLRNQSLFSRHRIAIVGDAQWKDLTLLFTGKGIRRVLIEYFLPADLPKARAWLSETP